MDNLQTQKDQFITKINSFAEKLKILWVHMAADDWYFILLTLSIFNMLPHII